LDARVKEKISEAEESFSNSGGNYGASLKSKQLVEDARTIIAESIGVNTRQIIFTSGATESLTLGIWNSLLVSRSSKKRVILGTIEHQAVINTVKVAARTLNFEIDYISAKPDGQYDLNELSRKIDGNVSLVALMYANNETGVFQDIEEITSLCHKYEAHHLGDTTQVIGRERFDYFRGNSDYRCISAHKFYGPKGMGALIASREVIESFESVIPGGGQEFGVRGGTSNVPGID
jgi:cysteine desulfurase